MPHQLVVCTLWRSRQASEEEVILGSRDDAGDQSPTDGCDDGEEEAGYALVEPVLTVVFADRHKHSITRQALSLQVHFVCVVYFFP